MDEKSIYNDESQVLTFSDKDESNNKNQIKINIPKKK